MNRLSVLLFGVAGCLGGSKSPLTDALPCARDAVAIYRVKAPKGGSLRVVVDTVSETTTFDPAFSLYEVSAWGDGVAGVTLGEFVEFTDDDFGCTYPPPEFECPQLITSIPAQDEDLAVIVEVVGACAGADAEYELTVELDGKSAKVKPWATGDYDSLAFPPREDTGF